MIWLAEDNPADVYLVRTSLRGHGVDAELRVAHDGEEAIRMIEEVNSGAPLPAVALVDLNLPKFSGPEVVKNLRESTRCHDVPVIIISSSPSLGDREEMRDLGSPHIFGSLRTSRISCVWGKWFEAFCTALTSNASRSGLW